VLRELRDEDDLLLLFVLSDSEHQLLLDEPLLTSEMVNELDRLDHDMLLELALLCDDDEPLLQLALETL